MWKQTVFLILLCAVYIGANRIRRRAGEPGPRIIGGEPATAGQFPFAAAIYITTADGLYFCAGTLISQEWVITAAQCVDGAISFQVILGTTDLTNVSSTAIRLATEHYVIHPDYNPQTLISDVGLIRFREPITYTLYVQPLQGFRNATTLDTYLTYGWGQLSDDQAGRSDHLYWVELVALSNEECRLYYGASVTDDMVCAAGNNNEGTCLGDSGGPLIYDQRGFIYHVGISTFLSGNGCESTDPSGFTRTRPYCEWIVNITETFTSSCF